MIAALLVMLAGAGVVVTVLVLHRRRQYQVLDELMDLAPDLDLPLPGVDAAADLSGDGVGVVGLAGRAVDLASSVVERVDHGRSLGLALERARIPLRPGEYLIVTGAAGLGVAAVLLAATGVVWVTLAGPAVAGVMSMQLVRRRIAKRRRAFETQLPDALGLVASSLSAGHTFLRAVQMMCEEAGPPISEEFARIVAETRLGDPLVDALERMAQRLQLRDFDIVVQAIRIQQSVGGRLSTLLHTLGDFIRARGELRREVSILTAEGRMSAYVLAGLVPFLFVMMNLLNPGYVEPLYSGAGLFILIGSALSVLAGMFMILRMVKIDV